MLNTWAAAAVVVGMAMITALCVIANWAYLRGLGYAGLAASDAPAAALMAFAFGQTGKTIIMIGVAVAALSAGLAASSALA